MDFISVILTEMKFHSGDKICKHYPKWNAYTCPWKYRVLLKCSRNETLCERNLFPRRFAISKRYEFISPLLLTYSKRIPQRRDLNKIQKQIVQRCSVKKVFLIIFAKFTGKYLYQRLFFNKVADVSLQLY